MEALFHYAASVFVFPAITKNEAFGVALALHSCRHLYHPWQWCELGFAKWRDRH